MPPAAGRVQRFAVVGLSALALSLAGCGFTSGLPPSASPAAERTADARVALLTSGNPLRDAPTPTAAPSPPLTCAQAIWWADAGRYLEKNETVQGPVIDVRDSTGGMLALDVGEAYPSLAGVVVRVDASRAGARSGLPGTQVCATGQVQQIDGYYTLTVQDPTGFSQAS